MPLVHPSAEPEQPHGHGRYDDDDVPDLGIVLREPAGQPRREDESEEDDSHDQVEDCAGGDLTWDCHHGWLLSLGLGAACCAWVLWYFYVGLFGSVLCFAHRSFFPVSGWLGQLVGEIRQTIANT